jgi:6-phosphofructokinase
MTVHTPTEALGELCAAVCEEKAALAIAGADGRTIGFLAYACGAETLREICLVLRRSDPLVDFALVRPGAPAPSGGA